MNNGSKSEIVNIVTGYIRLDDWDFQPSPYEATIINEESLIILPGEVLNDQFTYRFPKTGNYTIIIYAVPCRYETVFSNNVKNAEVTVTSTKIEGGSSKPPLLQ